MGHHALGQTKTLTLTRWQWLSLGGLVVIDQITKAVADQQGLSVLNKGVSFGFLDTLPTTVLTTLIIGVIVVCVWLWRTQGVDYAWTGVVLGAGAVSNVIDRVVLGGVRDWLPIPWLGNYNNLADWYITVGVVIYLWQVVVDARKTPATKKDLNHE